MPGLDKSKSTAGVVFLQPRCECEAIEKVTRPEITSAPKETTSSQKAGQNLQEPVVFLDGREGTLKWLTSTAPKQSSRQRDRILLIDETWLYLPSCSTPASIGTDVQKGSPVTIGDKERCGGVYVLGQPRTGKSDLLVSLALADIERGHGILFIDPHTDAINNLIARIPPGRRGDIMLLDPTVSAYRFGINLLRCDDPQMEMPLTAPGDG